MSSAKETLPFWMSCRLLQSKVCQTPPQTTPSSAFLTSVSNRIIYLISQVMKEVSCLASLSLSRSRPINGHVLLIQLCESVQCTPFSLRPLPRAITSDTQKHPPDSLPASRMVPPHHSPAATTSLVIFLSCLKTFSGSSSPTGKRSNSVQTFCDVVLERVLLVPVSRPHAHTV